MSDESIIVKIAKHPIPKHPIVILLISTLLSLFIIPIFQKKAAQEERKTYIFKQISESASSFIAESKNYIAIYKGQIDKSEISKVSEAFNTAFYNLLKSIAIAEIKFDDDYLSKKRLTKSFFEDLRNCITPVYEAFIDLNKQSNAMTNSLNSHFNFKIEEVENKLLEIKQKLNDIDELFEF